ncbi:MAG: hypothetical protein NT077_04180 [Candidatus Taylorbacteria bacterium]|nr:hypothetical protein [Candidatus Taylorbacteria bacterium]
MKKFVVWAENAHRIKHGKVTNISGYRIIVLFEDHTSAYADMRGGCSVTISVVGDTTFTNGDIRVPGLRVGDPVVVFLGKNPDWVHAWCHAVDYNNVKHRYEHDMEIARAALEKVTARRQKERGEWLEKARPIENVQQSLEALGQFRIVGAHKFHQEVDMRPKKLVTGSMSLARLLSERDRKMITFIPFQKWSPNDDLHQWIERQVGDEWVRVKLSDDDLDWLTLGLEGRVGIDDLSEIIARITKPTGQVQALRLVA